MYKILIIDDEVELLSLMTEHLSDQGYEVLSTCNGQDGLNLVNIVAPDLVITDIYMPVMDGLEVIRNLNKTYPDIKVIAISGGGSKIQYRYFESAILFGADATIEKPFSLSDFLALVSDIITDQIDHTRKLD